MENQRPERKKNNKIVWVIVILALIFFATKYVPGGMLDGDDLFKTEENETKTASVGGGDPYDLDGNGVPDFIEDAEDQEVVEAEEEDEIIAGLNACSYENFGYTDYDGTDKEGLTCADTVPSKQDLECVAHPPKNYDGSILMADSSAELSCCVDDGTCQWGVPYE